MHHTCAFYNSAVASATDTDINAVSDQILAIQNGHFLPQDDIPLVYAASFAATNQRMRLVTPKTRQVTTPYLRPVNTTLIPTTVTPVADLRQNPFVLRGLEEFQMNGYITTGPAPLIITAGLMAQYQAMPKGDVFTLRGTAAATAVVAAWTPATITWADTLPAGQYVCVGLMAIGTTLISARLNFENQYWRPGCVGVPAESSNPNPMFTQGGLGVWGRFTSTRMPLAEILCSAADTAQTFYMDIMRVG